MSTWLNRRGLDPAALGAEGQGSCVGMAEGAAARHFALTEGQPRACSKS